MKICSTGADAVNELHRKGFVHDFKLCGNDLLWIQEGFFLRPGAFTILEYHIIPAHEDKNTGGLVVFGIMALHHNIKGILINHFKTNSTITPPVLLKKLNELNVFADTIDNTKKNNG